jgi:hypothetical protein
VIKSSVLAGMTSMKEGWLTAEYNDVGLCKRLSTSLDVHFVIKSSVLADMASMKGGWLTTVCSDVGLYKRLSTSM